MCKKAHRSKNPLQIKYRNLAIVDFYYFTMNSPIFIINKKRDWLKLKTYKEKTTTSQSHKQ